jgi:hypothetical protein
MPELQKERDHETYRGAGRVRCLVPNPVWVALHTRCLLQWVKDDR